MKYSLILPIYNTGEFLEKCFDTILSQKYEDYEVILINDGSTDNSGEICDKYAEKDSRFKVFHLENGGVSNARNYGIEKAKGEYIWFLDPDDYIVGQPLSELESILEEYNSELVVFNYQDFDYKKNKYLDRCLPFSGNIDVSKFRSDFSEIFKTNMFYTVWNKIYKREFLVLNLLKFDEKVALGEDVKFNLEVYSKLTNIYFSDSSYYIYVDGRPTSAANIYRKERLDSKKEEFNQVKRLCEEFSIDYSDLSTFIRTNIFINVANNVVNSNMTYTEKYNELKSIYEDEFFSGIFKFSNVYFNRAFRLTLARGYINLFIQLKELDKKIKGIKK